jgi:hypothetical protein
MRSPDPHHPFFLSFVSSVKYFVAVRDTPAGKSARPARAEIKFSRQRDYGRAEVGSIIFASTSFGVS